jgi:hypothetical protein
VEGRFPTDQGFDEWYGVDDIAAGVESGQTPVVIDWDYLNSAETKKIPTWKVFVPSNALVGATTSRRSTRMVPILLQLGFAKSSFSATRVRTSS